MSVGLLHTCIDVHDANGNQITRTLGSDAYFLIYDAENRLVEVKKNGAVLATLVYDGDGNRVKGVVNTTIDSGTRGTIYLDGYRVEDYQTHTQGEYVYDGDGNRVRASENGAQTIFVGAHFEWTAAGSTKYYSAGGVIAFRREGYTADTGLFWLLSDHLGSATRVLAADGAPREQALYRAWGEVRLGEITLTDLSFTGQRRAIAGLTFYQARWMDNLAGRFISPDTMVPLESQGVMAWDRYQYTNSNPLRWNDPTGHFAFAPLLIAAAVGGLISGGANAVLQYQQKGSIDWKEAGSYAAGGAVAGVALTVAAPASLLSAFVAGGTANVLGNQTQAAVLAASNPSGSGFWSDFSVNGGITDGSTITNVGEAATDFVIGGTLTAGFSGAASWLSKNTYLPIADPFSKPASVPMEIKLLPKNNLTGTPGYLTPVASHYGLTRPEPVIAGGTRIISSYIKDSLQELSNQFLDNYVFP